MEQSLLSEYRSQTIKDYGLMIEYKHLKQYVPSGVYVLPSYDDPRVWFGTIFIRRGMYQGGVFKFKVQLPTDYNGPGTYPKVVFQSPVFNPFVNSETNQVDIAARFPEWNNELHYMVSVLEFLKSIFYLKQLSPKVVSTVNPQAMKLYHADPAGFAKNAELSVQESLEKVYSNDPESSFRFSKPIPAHQNLRSALFERNETGNDNKDMARQHFVATVMMKTESDKRMER